VIQLSVGGSNPSGSVVLSGTSNVPVLQIQLSNTTSTPVTITSLQVPVSGGSGVISVSVTNGSEVLGSAAPSAGTAVITLTIPLVLGPNGSGTYDVTFSFAPTASGNYGTVLNSNQVSAVYSNGTADVTGSAASNTFVVVEATQTATPTSTASLTATPAATLTPTPVSQTVISIPYPNPVHVAPVVVTVDSPGPANIKWGIYTLAFRKIASGEQNQITSTQLVWNLTDKAGNPVSDGLYYWVVEVAGNGSTVKKINKILVLK
jgi:hypothetical protein